MTFDKTKGNVMQIVRDSISVQELSKMAEKMFGRIVKVVVDVEQGFMTVDEQMHADLELYMLDNLGSKQEHLWGINLYPARAKQEDWIEFDSMINIRPGWGNSTRGVDDVSVQEKIRKLVNSMVNV